MSDAAALGLGEWFLADDSRRSVTKLIEILEGDPPLAAWVAAKTDRLLAARPRAVADLAGLLAEHGLAWLQWDESCPGGGLGLSPNEKIVIGETLEAAADPSGDPGIAAARLLPAVMARLARLARLEQTFRETVEVEKIAAMAEFAAGAGHEINNPLAVISGRVQLLLREETDPEHRSDLALIHAQAMRIKEMIADLRLFAVPPELQPASLDVAALVRGIVAELQPAASRQGTELVLLEPPTGLEVRADPVQLSEAVRLLCRNALEALGRGGRIEIDVSAGAGEVRIRVSDDGPGISPEHRPHIFEPFYSARQAGRGVGMGLSKCWRIVTQHGGSVDVAGCPGAAFTIRLPSCGPDLPGRKGG